jgi:GT2 family glycosyltransferase
VAVTLVSIVLVTWNSAPYLRRCLEGIAGQRGVETELIVVDNASTDGSEVHATIRNATNRGFSAAVNQGVAVARGEFVLVVNPDCFLTPDYAALLIEALRRAGDDYGAATGKLLRAQGYDITPSAGIDSMGMRMTRNGRHLDITEELAVGSRQLAEEGSTTANRQPPTANFHEVFGVSGAAALYRMSFLRDVAVEGEILDEDFFAYREDADLAWRGRLFGWRFLCVPAAVAYHVRRVTPEARRSLPAEINMHSVKNRFLLRSKNQGWYLALRNLPFELFRDAVVVAATLMVERSSLPAFAWLWRNRARIREKRRAVQSRRKVSDRELARWFR